MQALCSCPKRPEPLFPGAAVALLCPSSPITDVQRRAAVAAVDGLGLRPVLFESTRAAHGYLAGSDALRAADLNRAFADPDIHGILAMRGGYGAHRILPLLDWDSIAAHPKYLGGYSDITALHIALNQRCQLITYHTIMPASNYAHFADDYSMRQLERALFGTLTGRLEPPAGHPMKALTSGRAQGILCGGNLSVLTASLGTPFQIDTAGKILFLEDVNESHTRIDSMLTQLRNAGLLDCCAGILLGSFTRIPTVPAEETLPLETIFRTLLPQTIPILTQVACGHRLPSLALPLGAMLRMDANRNTLEFLN